MTHGREFLATDHAQIYNAVRHQSRFLVLHTIYDHSENRRTPVRRKNVHDPRRLERGNGARGRVHVVDRRTARAGTTGLPTRTPRTGLSERTTENTEDITFSRIRSPRAFRPLRVLSSVPPLQSVVPNRVEGATTSTTTATDPSAARADDRPPPSADNHDDGSARRLVGDDTRGNRGQHVTTAIGRRRRRQRRRRGRHGRKIGRHCVGQHAFDNSKITGAR